MQNQRQILLSTILADPNSTAAERAAAQKELYGSEHQTQAAIDHEIESYLNFDRKLGSNMAVEYRQSLSPAAQQLFNDMSNTQSFGMAPDAGSEERLQSLLNGTSSDLIKGEVIAAVRVIAWLRESGAPVHST